MKPINRQEYRWRIELEKFAKKINNKLNNIFSEEDPYNCQEELTDLYHKKTSAEEAANIVFGYRVPANIDKQDLLDAILDPEADFTFEMSYDVTDYDRYDQWDDNSHVIHRMKEDYDDLEI